MVGRIGGMVMAAPTPAITGLVSVWRYAPTMTLSGEGRTLERALLWLVTGFRVFGAGWMLLLGIVVLASNPKPDRPGWVVATLAVASLWTMVTVALALRNPPSASQWWFVAIDLAVAVLSIVAAVPAGSILFAGGYPLAGAFGAVYAKGAVGGAVAAGALTVASLARLPSTASIDQPATVSNLISYLFSAAAAAGGASVLRSGDRRRVEAEAALAEERARRARADERSEVAAHLHDSVLQTLALIQREPTASEPVRGLAKRQERELRSWLYEDTSSIRGGFRDAVESMVAEIQDITDGDVESVQVGDTAMNDPLEAMVWAGREALVNAIKHSGASTVSIYSEVSDGHAAIYVKDRGVGFDVAAIPQDRRGVTESILGRMERHGGEATIASTHQGGTEVRLTMPTTEATS